MSNDSLGDRMKSFYEDAYRIHLPRRLPIILRLDGCHFHSHLKNCKKPIDQGVVDCMNETAMILCKEIQGCQLAYIQSDEISLLLINYQTLDTQPWFDNNLQKMVSVASSIASVAFSMQSWKIWVPKTIDPRCDPMSECDFNQPAYFDARAFVVPKEEVNNAFLWRQQDATRNSVQMLARSLYSHKECHDKNNSELQEMIFQKGINWNDCPTSQKRGRCVIKKLSNKTATNPITGETIDTIRSEWVVDNEIPIFSSNRNYIEQYVYPANNTENNLDTL